MNKIDDNKKGAEFSLKNSMKNGGTDEFAFEDTEIEQK